MGDMRDYSFGDWFGIFIRAVPAYLIVTLLITGIPAMIAAIVWLLIPMR